MADPTLLEENVAETHITIGLNAYKELCGLHLGGKAELTMDVILGVTRKAANRAEIVITKIKEKLEKDIEARCERFSLVTSRVKKCIEKLWLFHSNCTEEVADYNKTDTKKIESITNKTI